MAAVCIWYKEEQKGNKTGMNQDRVYENPEAEQEETLLQSVALNRAIK